MKILLLSSMLLVDDYGISIYYSTYENIFIHEELTSALTYFLITCNH